MSILDSNKALIILASGVTQAASGLNSSGDNENSTDAPTGGGKSSNRFSELSKMRGETQSRETSLASILTDVKSKIEMYTNDRDTTVSEIATCISEITNSRIQIGMLSSRLSQIQGQKDTENEVSILQNQIRMEDQKISESMSKLNAKNSDLANIISQLTSTQEKEPNIQEQMSLYAQLVQGIDKMIEEARTRENGEKENNNAQSSEHGGKGGKRDENKGANSTNIKTTDPTRVNQLQSPQGTPNKSIGQVFMDVTKGLFQGFGNVFKSS